LPAPAVESPTPDIAAQDSRPAAQAEISGGTRHTLAVLSPLPAALAALLIHWLLPDRSEEPSTGLYRLLLEAFFVTAAVAAVTQWLWQPTRGWVRHYAPLLAGATALLCVWDLITIKLDIMPLPFFPGPDGVLAGLVAERDELLKSTYYSLRLLLGGYFGGVIMGLVTGVVMGWFANVRYWGVPLMKVVGPVPATALVPLAMVLFADPFFSGAALIALAVWFPVTMLTMSGIANVPVAYFDVARTLGAGRMYLIFRVAVPAAMPTIFIGLFMGLSVSFLTLIVAETVGVRSGLGWYLKAQQGYTRYDNVYASLVIMAVFFSGIMTLLFKVRDAVLGWQKGMIRW
jgi:NitT/TauT family transport system permease protein